MKTALELLLEKITLKKYDDETYLFPTISNKEIEEIKELEKKQIIDSLKAGINFEYDCTIYKGVGLTYSEFFEQYIKDTYGR